MNDAGAADVPGHRSGPALHAGHVRSWRLNDCRNNSMSPSFSLPGKTRDVTTGSNTTTHWESPNEGVFRLGRSYIILYTSHILLCALPGIDLDSGASFVSDLDVAQLDDFEGQLKAEKTIGSILVRSHDCGPRKQAGLAHSRSLRTWRLF